MYPRPLMHVRLSLFCLHGDCDLPDRRKGGEALLHPLSRGRQMPVQARRLARRSRKKEETTGKHGLPLGMVSLCLSVASHVIYLV